MIETLSIDPVSFTRHGELRKQEANEFSSASIGNRKYVISRGQFHVEPPSILTYKVTGIKFPIDIAAGVDSEMPLITHRKIVALALVKTGFVTEHQALTLMGEQTN